MKYIHITIILLAALICSTAYAAEDLSAITNAGGTIYFAQDFESGLLTPDAGIGTWGALGGLTSGPAGPTGCDDPAVYHNTVISTDDAINGTHSLKTPYSGACPRESSTRDVSRITFTTGFGPGQDVYIRWYQKFTGDWNSAYSEGSGWQHKFTKFYSGTVGQYGAHFSFSGNDRHWQNYMLDDGRWGNAGSYIFVSAAQDDSPATSVFDFVPDRWYLIEIHFRLNSDANTSDGITEAWVDGNLVFSVANYRFYLSGSGYHVNLFELQHIYYVRSANDQPTYMDNIVMASMRIGGISGLSPPPGTSSLSPLPGRYATKQTVTVTTTGSTVLTCTGTAPCTPATAYTAPVPVYPDDYLCTSTDGGAAVCGQYRFPVRCH